MSSKRRIRRRSCEGKIRYKTSGGAYASIKRQERFDLHPYKCSFCGGYHLGHEPKWNKIQRYERLNKK